jgi:DMSO/TMAO reductase YedYZ molybdopterin-dependent catalytic subunit
LKERLSQKSLMAITLGLILSISLMGTIGKFSTVASATATSDSEWRLIVYQSNNNYLNLSMSDLAAMPKSTVYADLYCYGTIVTSGNWGGVNLAFLLNTAGLNQDTATIQFRAADGYSINLPMQDAMQQNVIIAYEKDDQPLSEVLRLVVPMANGNIWISMITSISQSNVPVSEPQAPINSAPPKPEQILPPPQQLQTSEPKNQSTASPVIPPSNKSSNSQSEPAPQQNSPNSSLPMEYSYLMISTIIASIAVVSGFLFYKRRK